VVSPGNGHALICIASDKYGDAPLPEIQAYEREIRPEVDRRLGPRAGLINPIVATVFPNFSLLRGTSRTFRVWQPRGPGRTEVWSWVFVDKAAPRDVKEAFRLSGVRGFSPSGTFEQDDMDNWQECTQTCRGVASRRMPINNQIGARPRALRSGARRLDERFRFQREQPPAVLRALGRGDGGE
jgi:hypothetical protein